MTNLKNQNYLHFKLPITINPIEFGKLIDQFDNKYIIQLNTTNNIVIISIRQIDNNNFVKFFRKGEFIFEFKDSKISENTFIRTILDQKYTFKDNKLISTEILINHFFSKLISLFVRNINSTTLLNYKSNLMKNIILIKNIENIYKNKKKELFILFELLLIFLIYIIFFVIFPEYSCETSMVALSGKNIIKLRRVPAKNIWNDIIFKINNKIFTRNLFEKIFNQFWDKIENEFTNSNHMFILFKIKYNNGELSSIGKVQRINKSDYSWYIDFIIESMKFKSEYYNEIQIDSLIFSYGFKSCKIKNKESFVKNKLTLQNYKNYNLPISTSPMDYGRLMTQKNLEESIFYILQNDKGQTITINKFANFNEVEYLKEGISLIKFKDILINENKFMRIVDNKKFYFENGEQILFQTEMKTKFIAKTQKTKDLVNNFITLDIETYIDGNTLIPFLICFYDGKKSYFFGLWDYENVEQMVLACLKSILIRKYKGYKVYVHNLAKFDIIFLLKYLVKVATIQPVIHNGRIISVTVNFGKNSEYQIEFRDSYLILLKSLRELCGAFKVETIKSIFPFFFVNANNLNYIGKVPDYKYFIDISKNDYNEYKSKFNNNWNLENEVVKYCEIDCISLYQIIYKFNDFIFNLFSVNIHRYPTLPSLAFGIFRSNFMPEKRVPQLSGKIAADIRSGYTGGSCEVYIPKFVSKPGVKMKCLDVNSLYPSQMESQLMPVGIPTFFEGDINSVDTKAFGFFFCRIIAPDDILHPILQTHVNTHGGKRTMAPIGQWEDMLFSEEMKNAIKLGYKIEVLWGYTFEKENIFKEYVDFLWNLRSEYSSSHPLNYIAKILMNSLYGRFGMDDNFMNISIIHKDYYPDFENKYLDYIEEKIELEDYFIVFYNSGESSEESDNGTHNVSIGIAAAITAYARVHMSQFKNNPKINLYYTDTDSVYTDSEIDESLINPKVLGKLKLENTCNKAIFLSPKVYCLETIDNKTIYKVKGLKHEVELIMNDFEQLLNKDALISKSQDKWRRKLSEGKIDILKEVYTLEVTDNKRKLIYDENNKLIGTSPYSINKFMEIINK